MVFLLLSELYPTRSQSGADEFSGGDLHSQTAETHISGMGSATVWVDKELNANISGAGDVKGLGEK